MTFPHQLQYSHFVRMAEMEASCYSPQFITPPEEAWEWYLRYPATTTAALEGDTVAGFVNLFPVTNDVYQSILSGRFNDRELTADGIGDLKLGEPLNMFLSCIVVNREHRGRGLSRQLLIRAAEQYRPWEHLLLNIVTDNVTPDGEKLSISLGFEKAGGTEHGSRLFVQPYVDFLHNIRR